MTAPTIVLKNQYGEESINKVLAGSTEALPVAANTIMANLTGAEALPTANSYAAVSAKLTPAQLLTGFTAGAGTVTATDTVLQALQKITANIQNLTVLANVLTGYAAAPGTISAADTVLGAIEKLDRVATHQADSVAADVPTLVADFNALLLKLQNAKLMA